MARVPAPENLVYTRWRFSLTPTSGVTEIAEFGLYSTRHHNVGNTVDWDSDLGDMAQKLYQSWQNSFTTVEGLFSPAAKLVGVDAYQIGPDGKVAHAGTFEGPPADAWKGSGAAGLPFENSVVVSTSAFAVGTFTADPRNKRGRFYLPPPSAGALSTDGRLSTGSQSSLKTAVDGFLNDVQGKHYQGTVGAGSDDYVNLVIYSTVRNKSPRLVGVTYDLTDYRVGDVVDTQRRRRNALVENYLSGTVDHS